uniref:Uncharacterized protein n=1 Tax=Anguilla anguilla TaxID=7936 RepID=A0A0E9XH31_ANGAN
MIMRQVERARLDNLARTPGNPLLFVMSVMGSLMTTVSQDLNLLHPPVCFL